MWDRFVAEGVDLYSNGAIDNVTSRVDWIAFDFGNVARSAGEESLIDLRRAAHSLAPFGIRWAARAKSLVAVAP